MSERTREHLTTALVLVAALAWFWFWRTIVWSGGDSEQWEREIHGGIWWRKRQMLSFATMQLIFQITSHLWHWSPRLAINLSSCLAGAVAMAIAWRWTAGLPERGSAFALVALSGSTLLFYGHIETYALPTAAVYFFALAAKRVLEERWPLWVAGSALSLCVWFHLVLLLCVPAFALLLFHCWRRSTPARGEVIRAAASLAPIPLLHFLVTKMHWGEGDLLGSHLLGLTSAQHLHRFPALSWSHFAMKAWFLWHVSGIASPLALWALWRTREQPLSQILAVLLTGALAFHFAWHPDAGRLDWDLFSFAGSLCTLTLAQGLNALPVRALLCGLAIGLNVQTLICEVPVNAQAGARAHSLVTARGVPENGNLWLDDRLEISSWPLLIEPGLHTVTFRAPHTTPATRVLNAPDRVGTEFELDVTQWPRRPHLGMKIFSLMDLSNSGKYPHSPDPGAGPFA